MSGFENDRIEAACIAFNGRLWHCASTWLQEHHRRRMALALYAADEVVGRYAAPDETSLREWLVTLR